MPAVEVFELVVRHGDRVAVDGVSFTADAGEIVTVLGPNGAGKTTTVETLEGYRRPAGGTVRLLGCDPVADKAQVVARMGVMLQRGGIYPGMAARDALRLFAAYYEEPLDPAGLIERLGLGDVATTPWRRLSGGEQQRLSLALALVGRPDVVFLDEPTAGVDPAGRLVIRDMVRSLRDDGRCVVMTTHELHEAERLSDRVIVLAGGRVVASGTPRELMGSAAGDEILFGAPPAIDVASLSEALGGALVTEPRPGEYRVATPATPAAVARLTAWLAERDLPIADLRAARHTLEDVFLRLTADGTGDDRPGAPSPPGAS